MFVTKLSTGGIDCYNTSLPISFLIALLEKMDTRKFPSAQQWLVTDARSVDEMTTFIFDQIKAQKSWFLGGFTLGILSDHTFTALKTNEVDNIPGDSYGFLHFPSPQIWIPIDGLHRLVSLARVSALLQSSSPDQATKLLNSQLPVTILPLASGEELPELLMRMHKSVRTGDRGETIRTAFQDVYSTYARRLMGDDEPFPAIFPKELINWKTNTLTNRLAKLSTLSVLYDSSKTLDGALEARTPDAEQRYAEIAHIWDLLLKEFSPFQRAIEKPSYIPLWREQLFCLKPTGQLTIIAVLALALSKNVPIESVIERLNALPWEIQNDLWKNVVITGGRINASTSAIKLISLMIAYIIGIPLNNSDIRYLIKEYQQKTGERGLPDPRFDPFPTQSLPAKENLI